jgi:SAM-dependent methyltransferase
LGTLQKAQNNSASDYRYRWIRSPESSFGSPFQITSAARKARRVSAPQPAIGATPTREAVRGYGAGSLGEPDPGEPLAAKARRGVVSQNRAVRSTVQREHQRVNQNYFGEVIAARYDGGHMFAPEVLGPTVKLLAELVGDGAALEFAIGTGRVAVPLADRGVPVSGIELSTAMADRLRAKDQADRIKVTIGDMATTRVEGSFRLVYLVYNGIGNLLTQDQQVACFANAAAHLEPGGYFLIEVGVPDLRRLPPGEDARVFFHAPGYVGYDRYTDLVAQQAMSHHFVANDTGTSETRTPFRYVWPSELDLMARLSGLSLIHRWADWDRSSFSAESTSHVSVWQTAEASP